MSPPSDHQPNDIPPNDGNASRDVSRRDLLTSAATLGAGVVATQLLAGCATNRSSSATTQTVTQVEEKAVAPPATPATTPVKADTVEVKLQINGQEHVTQLEPRVTLLDALRDHLGMPGTKKGCDHGQCGACTVLIDSRRVNSCLTLAIAAQGQKITTIEGLANGDELHPVQAAFIKHDGFQCGYCTPGQICSAVGLINEGHAKSDDDIREQMAGNICRCGAYPNIVDAVKECLNT